jgi:hypothetical protein
VKRFGTALRKGEAEARMPTWYCEMRRTMTARALEKRNAVRKPAGPMGNQDQRTVMKPSQQGGHESKSRDHVQESKLPRKIAMAYDRMKRKLAVEENLL